MGCFRNLPFGHEQQEFRSAQKCARSPRAVDHRPTAPHRRYFVPPQLLQKPPPHPLLLPCCWPTAATAGLPPPVALPSMAPRRRNRTKIKQPAPATPPIKRYFSS